MRPSRISLPTRRSAAGNPEAGTSAASGVPAPATPPARQERSRLRAALGSAGRVSVPPQAASPIRTASPGTASDSPSESLSYGSIATPPSLPRRGLARRRANGPAQASPGLEAEASAPDLLHDMDQLPPLDAHPRFSGADLRWRLAHLDDSPGGLDVGSRQSPPAGMPVLTRQIAFGSLAELAARNNLDQPDLQSPGGAFSRQAYPDTPLGSDGSASTWRSIGSSTGSMSPDSFSRDDLER